jgi:hypothetical protein
MLTPENSAIHDSFIHSSIKLPHLISTYPNLTSHVLKVAMPFWTIGTLFGASSVMLGAFGAHGLKARISDPARLANWGTAAQYQVRLFPLFFLSRFRNDFFVFPSP